MVTDQTKEKRGGSNRGQGRKRLYAEPTEVVSFCVPGSKIPEIKEVVRVALEKYKI